MPSSGPVVNPPRQTGERTRRVIELLSMVSMVGLDLRQLTTGIYLSSESAGQRRLQL